MSSLDVGDAAKLDACSDGCGCQSTPVAAADPRLRRWVWWLTALTVGWNSLEAIVAIAGGLIAGSIALVGFGLDSMVEVGSALVIVWRLSCRGTESEADERIERRAVRLITVTFFAIAVYVVYDSATKLLGKDDERHSSPIGLAITALSLVVMPMPVAR